MSTRLKAPGAGLSPQPMPLILVYDVLGEQRVAVGEGLESGGPFPTQEEGTVSSSQEHS